MSILQVLLTRRWAMLVKSSGRPNGEHIGRLDAAIYELMS